MKNMVKRTRIQKSILNNSYEVMVVLDDLICEETDDDKKEKLRIIRKDVHKIVNFSMQGYTEKQR